MAQLTALFQALKDTGGSDLHIMVGEPPKLRVHGVLSSVEGHPPYTLALIQQSLAGLLRPDQLEIYNKHRDLDFVYNAPGIGRVRCNYYVQNAGPAAVFRFIPERVQSLQELNLPPILGQLADYPKGLVLVTGPSGSGKSTTLAAILNEVNERHPRHIITIEDPLEFVHIPKKSVFSHREVGQHCTSFESGLRAAMHEDPNVIFISELGDLSAIRLALLAAETGFVVFGTVRTNTVPKTLERIIDAFPADQRPSARAKLADSLLAVVSQLLVMANGKQGRVAANEILLCNPAVTSSLREGNINAIRAILQGGGGKGIMTMDDSLEKLIRDQKADPEDAYAKSVEKQRFQKYQVHKLSV